jgi:hypothetical protein
MQCVILARLHHQIAEEQTKEPEQLISAGRPRAWDSQLTAY